MEGAFFDALRLLAAGDEALWSSVRLSLAAATGAVLAATPFALAAAWALAGRSFFGRRAAVALLHGLLAFPTVVVGLVLYLLLSRHGPLGAWRLLFTPWAIGVGQFFIALPVLAVFALSAFEATDRRARETAATLGASLPRAALTEISEARFGIVAGLLAGFGRVVSEVGCALLVGGNIAGHTRTIPTAIVLETGRGAFAQGIALGLLLLLLALLASAGLAFLQSTQK